MILQQRQQRDELAGDLARTGNRPRCNAAEGEQEQYDYDERDTEPQAHERARSTMPMIL